jgi:hypothetical protein
VTEQIAQAIDRYLRSGECEHDHPEWPGQNILEKATRGHDDLLDALVKEVQRRAAGREHTPVPTDLDLVSWTRRKLTPMVEGFFPRAERDAVLALLERSVVFITTDRIESVLLRQSWLHSYSCEAYGWIVAHAKTKADRLAMREEFASRASRFGDENVEPQELGDIVREACEARNGWKVILRRCACALQPRRRRAMPASSEMG